MWWVYFDRPMHHLLDELRTAVAWGYGHLFLFGSAAAVGAGLEVAIGRAAADHGDQAAEVSEHGVEPVLLSSSTAGLAVAVPVAVFLASLWLLQMRTGRPRILTAATPPAALLILVAPLVAAPVHLVAGVMAALVVLHVVVGHARTV